jgi:hypothetical protein
MIRAIVKASGRQIVVRRENILGEVFVEEGERNGFQWYGDELEFIVSYEDFSKLNNKKF